MIVAWVRRVFPGLRSMDPFQLLELDPTDDPTAITAAFEHMFETRHPDLFRGALTHDEFVKLEAVFAAVVHAHRRLLDRPRLARGSTPASGPKGD
jgi:hypothetical protein